MIKNDYNIKIGDRVNYKRRNKTRNVKVRNIIDNKLFCIDDKGIAYVILIEEVIKKG